MFTKVRNLYGFMNIIVSPYLNVPFQGEIYDTGFQEMENSFQKKHRRNVLSQSPFSQMGKHEGTFNFLCELELESPGLLKQITKATLCLIWCSSLHRTDLPSHPAHRGLFEARLLFMKFITTRYKQHCSQDPFTLQTDFWSSTSVYTTNKPLSFFI